MTASRTEVTVNYPANRSYFLEGEKLNLTCAVLRIGNPNTDKFLYYYRNAGSFNTPDVEVGIFRINQAN